MLQMKMVENKSDALIRYKREKTPEPIAQMEEDTTFCHF
jgi:hypothetical protein